jgi:hypothetical protein
MQKKIARSKVSYNNPAGYNTTRDKRGTRVGALWHAIAIEYPSTLDYPVWYVHVRESFGSCDRWEACRSCRSLGHFEK